MRRAWKVALCGAILLHAGCAQMVTPWPEAAGAAGPYASVQPFSLTSAGETAPVGWEPWILSRFLARTQYQIVEHDGERVLAASANVSASGLLQPLAVSVADYPYLSWRWKVPELIADADNASRIGDDSPVRVIIAFDGDRSKLDFEDQSLAETVKLFSGREMPYATIQYIWENRLPPETVLDNARTSRSKMLVVESGPQQLGKWLYFKRNVKADYERLFGESPGPVIFVGIMTDSNATQSRALAYYGDIRLSREE
ncbi:MAG: DUF3047 domain-containing protein [Burkholderiales bacterium]|nr:DUF3047 domain-containing protein [Burkholderiales bacterium]